MAIPSLPSTSQAPDHDYNSEYFIYNNEEDTYTCPQGGILRTNGTWYKEHDKRGNLMVFKQYRTGSCKTCPVHSQCTRSKKERILSKTSFAEYYEKNRKTYHEKEKLYKRRQAIVEHHYGTIKRQWGFSYILTKKRMSRASSDVGFMFIAYNLRRIGNILTRDRLMEYLRILLSLFLSFLELIRGTLRQSQISLSQTSINLV